MSNEEYLGYQNIGPDRYLGPPRYKITCRCLRCGNEYSKVMASIPTNDPPCPRKKCKEAALEEEIEKRARNMAKIIEEQHAPGIIGDKPMVGIIDKTANIVMEDHKLTDLKDNIREGEAMIPKLPGQMQQMADGFFGGKAVAERQGMKSRQMDLLGRRAIAGAFRGMSVSPGQVIHGTSGEPALRKVRDEKLRP